MKEYNIKFSSLGLQIQYDISFSDEVLTDDIIGVEEVIFMKNLEELIAEYVRMKDRNKP